MKTKKTTLTKETLNWLSENFTRHGGDCFHFHRNGTACLDRRYHADAMSFPVYKWRDPSSLSIEGMYFPYFLNEEAMIGYFEYYGR